MVDIQELLRVMTEALVDEIVDVRVEDVCADGNQRNGYRERALVTSAGVVSLRIPKLGRGSYFPEDLLVRYSRIDWRSCSPCASTASAASSASRSSVYGKVILDASPSVDLSIAKHIRGPRGP
ncbi:transposase, partial [Adlercreutzia sp. R25]|uniref:transposase n=1 Tax=Adlercreutzia shanghongiae TaxID=3111773 RepID=UPI002DB90FAB